MTAAIIPARGGSIRLPWKNVLPLCGLPLVAWTIIQAKSAHLIDRVYLSTDDDEIEAIGREYGAEIIRRPDWPDADLAAGSRPVRHAMKIIKAEHPDFDTVFSLFPTMPLRWPDDIDNIRTEFERRGRAMPLYGISRNYETQIIEDIGDGVWKRTFYSRDPKYLSQTASLSIHSYEQYFDDTWSEEEGDHDADYTANYAAGKKNVTGFYEVPKRPWADTDILADFEFAGLVFEYFILKGRGRAVYDDYGTAT